MKTIIGVFLAVFFLTDVFSQQTFNSFESLLNHAVSNSKTLYAGELNFSQAKKARISALLGVIDPSGNISFSYTNNTRLPVSLFPAEIFGGEAGTFQEIQTGVQHVTNQTGYVELKLINPQGIAQLKTARLNTNLTASTNKVSLKSFQESIADVYYNIISLQSQEQVAQQNLAVADTLLQIVQEKFKLGLTSKQTVNDAEVNRINVENNLAQIQNSISQQYLLLKIIADIPENESLLIAEQMDNALQSTGISVQTSSLKNENSLLSERYSLAVLQQQRLSFSPTLALFYGQGTVQYNTSAKLWSESSRWIPSNYIGLKLQFQIPTVTAISQLSKAKYDYLRAQNATQQTLIQSENDRQQLQLNYEKAVNDWKSYQRIAILNEETYLANKINYEAGILSLETLLTSFNAMVNANYNLISSATTIQLVRAKIEIHNTLK
jgi:outer membrane protein TolC